MSVIYRRTSILESPAQTLVNTVNCVGIMGKGLAKEFKSREPAMFVSYKQLCDQGVLKPGVLWLWRGKHGWVLNFPTKVHWRNPSRVDWIELGLKKFAASYRDHGIEEISFPRLGCGNGDLDWDEVRPVMEHYLNPLDIPVFIHDYSVDIGLPEHLEPIADVLREEGWQASSFDDFVGALSRALELSRGQLALLGTGEAFGAVMAGSRLGLIDQTHCTWLEEDDLRGVWASLQSGLVTARKAGWSVVGAGPQVLSLMSVLPYVRPVEIESKVGRPEIAIERCPAGPTFIKAGRIPPSARQVELEWR